MAIEPGTYDLSPENGKLSVRTGKSGAASKAGHNLLMDVGSWGATVVLGTEPEQTLLELTADSRSLQVLEGSGGVHSLGEDDKAGIGQTIDDEVLKGTTIAFRSTAVAAAGDGRFTVQGDLELWGGTNPITFELQIDGDGRVAGSAIIKQTAWGVKPYSALFGTLKVADDVEVSIDARLGTPV